MRCEKSRMSPPTAETSAQLHAPQDAEQLLAALGGQEVIVSFAKQSQQLANTINRNVREGVSRSGQDFIYQGMGLKHLLAHSELFKERFDALGASLVEVAKKRGYDVSFQGSPSEVVRFRTGQSERRLPRRRVAPQRRGTWDDLRERSSREGDGPRRIRSP